MTLEYQTPGPAQAVTRHDHIYTTLLGVGCFLIAIAMVSTAWIRLMPTVDPGAKPAMLMAVSIEAMFLAPMLAVLLIRILWPAKRYWPTLALTDKTGRMRFSLTQTAPVPFSGPKQSMGSNRGGELAVQCRQQGPS